MSSAVLVLCLEDVPETEFTIKNLREFDESKKMYRAGKSNPKRYKQPFLALRKKLLAMFDDHLVNSGLPYRREPQEITMAVLARSCKDMIFSRVPIYFRFFTTVRFL